MFDITWDQPNARHFEAGIDRGVFYPVTGSGVPWNGLVSVNEDAAGGELSSYYYDGNKYLDFVAAEDFQATIEAFTSPPEFDECDGSLELLPGFYATRQPRKRFGLSYRTMVGNNLRGIRAAYKLNLVYNAIAQPTSKTRATLTETVDPSNFQWAITSVPPPALTYKPTAHFVIDSRTIDPDKLTILEGFLYGHVPDDMIIDGGSPSYTSPDVLDGGTPSLTSFGSVDGGSPWSNSTIAPQLPSPDDVFTYLSE